MKWLQVGFELSTVSIDYEDVWRFAMLDTNFPFLLLDTVI